jgi:predicted nucleic acid-binding Zn ribbon protein
MPITRQCLNCGQSFTRPSRGRTQPKFCSSLCANQYRWGVGNRPRLAPTRPCAICGQQFTSWRASRKTCSDQCARALRFDESRLRRVRTCERCGKEFLPADRHLRRVQPVTCPACREASRSLRETVCKVCGKQFGHTSPTRLYCSPECKAIGRHCDKDGRRIVSTTPRKARETLFAIRGVRCEQCGYDRIPGILLVHHADCDRSNNLEDNLVILCPNCHAEAHWAHGQRVPSWRGANNVAAIA